MSARSQAAMPEEAQCSEVGERLRSTGFAAGALVGGGVAMLIPALAFAAFSIAFSTYGRNTEPQLTEPWLVAPLAAGLGLILLGWLVSARRLRRWRGRGARRVTAAGVALAALVGLLADVAMFGVMFVFESVGVAPTERLLWPVAGGLGWAAGSFVGRRAWPALRSRLPRHG